MSDGLRCFWSSSWVRFSRRDCDCSWLERCRNLDERVESASVDEDLLNVSIEIIKRQEEVNIVLHPLRLELQ